LRRSAELYIKPVKPEDPRMFIEPRQLIAETIDKLETVATFFADEVDERVRAPEK